MTAESLGAIGNGEDLTLITRVVARHCVDSTNEEARRLACQGAESGTVVWALRQTAGRGRRGRRWRSPEGNLYCSVIVRPTGGAARAAQLSLVAAVAVGEAIAACLPQAAPRPRLKWPNDVIVNGRKIAGILLESDSGSREGDWWLTVGIGVNILHFPEDVEYPATALVREGASISAPDQVLNCLLERFTAWYRRWCLEGFTPVRDAWLEYAAGVGAPVTVRLHNETFTGLFVGLDGDGALLVELPEGGALRRVSAGDVFFPWLTEEAGGAALGAAPFLS